jgi:iron complex transport system permease protein
MSQWYIFRSQRFPISFRVDRRVPPVLLVLALASVGALVLSIGTGEYPISPGDVIRTLVGSGAKEHDFIVNTLRLPRALIAFLVGVGLAMSGAILQGVARNPLAAPEVVGITAGANLTAASLIVLAPNTPWAALPPAALGGAFVSALLTYLIAWKKGTQPIRFILVGIGIASIAQALVSLIVAQSRIYRIGEAMLWIAGSVYGRSWEQFGPLALWLLALIPLALLLSGHLNALQLGDDVARGLGSRVERARGMLLLVSVGLAGVAVATAGSVGFVGLMAPHVARRLVGSSQGGLLPVSGMVGGLLVVLADLLGRSLFPPLEIPCGVITAAIGAPYFIYLLYKNRNM